MTGLFGDLVPAAAAAPATNPAIATINANRAARGLPPLPGHAAPATGAATPPPAGGTATPPPPATGGAATPPGNSALSAFQTFYNSPTYQVPLKEGLKAVNTKYAAMGALESGAAMKAINQYGADHAASALGTYMDDLYRQEALGEAASSSLAGVGQNLVTQVSSNNNNAANAAGNAALVGGQSTANNWNNIGSAIGTAAGSIGGALSSYQRPPAYDYGALQDSGIYGDAFF